ncbi:hypothetical protein PTKIN_Ptkin01aG0145200 [Pterospermum kingtungense]
MVDRFNEIFIRLKQLGKEIYEEDLIKKLLNTLPKEQKPKMIAIKEANDLSQITFDKIIGSLLTYEQELRDDEGEERSLLTRRKTWP